METRRYFISIKNKKKKEKEKKKKKKKDALLYFVIWDVERTRQSGTL